jgi:hypothetical protein
MIFFLIVSIMYHCMMKLSTMEGNESGHDQHDAWQSNHYRSCLIKIKAIV